MIHILMYHDIAEEILPAEDILPAEGSILRKQPFRSVLSQPVGRFAAQMQWLVQHQYRILPLQEVVARISFATERALPQSLPKKAVAITFDDALASVYARAFPILQRYEIPASVFVVTGFVGANNAWDAQPPAGSALPHIPSLATMTWEQLLEMHRWGVEIGSHGLTHPRLDLVSEAVQAEEIQTSRMQLEAILGHPVRSFAYPYGRWNDSSLRWVRQTYACACTTRLASVPANCDPHLLPRLDACYLGWMPLFRMLSTRGMDAYLAGVRAVRAIRQFL